MKTFTFIQYRFINTWTNKEYETCRWCLFIFHLKNTIFIAICISGLKDAKERQDIVQHIHFLKTHFPCLLFLSFIWTHPSCFRIHCSYLSRVGYIHTTNGETLTINSIVCNKNGHMRPKTSINKIHVWTIKYISWLYCAWSTKKKIIQHIV